METEKKGKGLSATKTGGCSGSKESHCSASNEDDSKIIGKRLDAKMKELIAIGASVACNCQPCVKYHTSKANELNIEPELIKQAIEVGKMVRKGAADQMDELFEQISNQL